jgi:hypothetical protein
LTKTQSPHLLGFARFQHQPARASRDLTCEISQGSSHEDEQEPPQFLSDAAVGVGAAALVTPLGIGGRAFIEQPARVTASQGHNTSKPPLSVSSANGVAAVSKAVEVMQAGGDTLDAVIAGVNIVELDPKDNSVGYGGLLNERGDVELDASVMHGPTRGRSLPFVGARRLQRWRRP